MKVLQINVVYQEKSTGRTCAEVENYLKKKGHECYTAYGVGKRKAGDSSYKIETTPGYYFHNVMSRITGLEGYFSFLATKRLVNYIKKIKPDVIHLHNLHGHYLNLPILFEFLKKTQIPVVINLHDCWIFTGKCTHPVRVPCTKWEKECKDCPALGEYPQSYRIDRSKKMYQGKKKWLSEINLKKVIGVSDWVAEQARMSMLREKPIIRIYNWIDMDVFHPYQENEVMDEFHIEKNKFTIICVAAAWKEGSKKNNELNELISKLDKDMQVVLVGEHGETIKGEHVCRVGFLNDIQKLAQLYSAADVYVHVSAADTFGKVIAEAMACGTPAVAYDCTACTELIEENCGYVVPLHDVDALLHVIKEVKQKGKDSYASFCVARVKRDFDYHTNCQRLLDVYEGAVR